MDSSSGMSYLQNQIQHKKLEHDSENCFSVQWLNAPLIVGIESFIKLTTLIMTLMANWGPAQRNSFHWLFML